MECELQFIPFLVISGWGDIPPKGYFDLTFTGAQGNLRMQSATSGMDEKPQKRVANTRLLKSRLPQVTVSPRTTELGTE